MTYSCRVVEDEVLGVGSGKSEKRIFMTQVDHLSPNQVWVQ